MPNITKLLTYSDYEKRRLDHDEAIFKIEMQFFGYNFE